MSFQSNDTNWPLLRSLGEVMNLLCVEVGNENNIMYVLITAIESGRLLPNSLAYNVMLDTVKLLTLDSPEEMKYSSLSKTFWKEFQQEHGSAAVRYLRGNSDVILAIPDDEELKSFTPQEEDIYLIQHGTSVKKGKGAKGAAKRKTPASTGKKRNAVPKTQPANTTPKRNTKTQPAYSTPKRRQSKPTVKSPNLPTVAKPRGKKTAATSPNTLPTTGNMQNGNDAEGASDHKSSDTPVTPFWLPLPDNKPDAKTQCPYRGCGKMVTDIHNHLEKVHSASPNVREFLLGSLEKGQNKTYESSKPGWGKSNDKTKRKRTDTSAQISTNGMFTPPSVTVSLNKKTKFETSSDSSGDESQDGNNSICSFMKANPNTIITQSKSKNLKTNSKESKTSRTDSQVATKNSDNTEVTIEVSAARSSPFKVPKSPNGVPSYTMSQRRTRDWEQTTRFNCNSSFQDEELPRRFQDRNYHRGNQRHGRGYHRGYQRHNYDWNQKKNGNGRYFET